MWCAERESLRKNGEFVGVDLGYTNNEVGSLEEGGPKPYIYTLMTWLCNSCDVVLDQNINIDPEEVRFLLSLSCCARV